MRSSRQVTSVGGKGFDTSVVLRALQQDTVAIGFIAGLVGEHLTRLLEIYGIRHDLVWVDGETRTAHVIVETRHHRHSHLMTGELKTTPQHHKTLLERLKFHIPAAKWLICGGSTPSDTPPDIFQRIVQAAQDQNIPTLIDSSGPSLYLAANANPTILKMNSG